MHQPRNMLRVEYGQGDPRVGRGVSRPQLSVIIASRGPVPAATVTRRHIDDRSRMNECT